MAWPEYVRSRSFTCVDRQRCDVNTINSDARDGADFEEAQDAAQERTLPAPTAATDADLGGHSYLEAKASASQWLMFILQALLLVGGRTRSAI